jgi:pto-interacting protein 1
VNHLHAAVFFEIPFPNIYREFDVIVSFSSGATKGFKDSATQKVESHNATPPIDIPVLSLDELIEKTDDFGSTALIGEGSYGRVYYAVLDNGTKMAVKKLYSTENEPTTEFLTQVGVVINY